MRIQWLAASSVLYGFMLIGFAVFVVAAHTMDDFTGQVFPKNHALNMPIDSLPVHPNSNNFIQSMGGSTRLHPDFGTEWFDGDTIRQMGIPYNVVGASQELVPITYTLYGDESDPGPWPIPRNPYIETVFNWRDTRDGDRHMLIIDSSRQMLYETGNVIGNADGTEWKGGCGAVFDLTSTALRPASWTSADAAGLPIFSLLIRYDEVNRAVESGGEVSHAIRFTASRTQRAYIWPARHYASQSTDENRPPMGLRFRLKAQYDISPFTPRVQVILRTMKKYGLIMSDNGSNWYFQGTHDDRWDNEELNTLKTLRGNDFEAVDISPWTNRSGFDPNSAAVPAVSADVLFKNDKILDPSNIIIKNDCYGDKCLRTITYTITNTGPVCIQMVDIQGRAQQMLTDKIHRPGKYSITFTKKSSSGISILCFRAGRGAMKSESIMIIR